MSRREFLRLLAGAGALAALPRCAAVPNGVARVRPIRAVAFDLFTIFDPRSIGTLAETIVPGRGPELAMAWRGRQFEYGFLRAAGERYVDFRRVTEDALVYATKLLGLELDAAQRRRLVDGYQELDPWPDAVAALHALREAGLRLAPLANYAPAMLAALLARAGLTQLFEHLLSTDRARTFKPSPRAYRLAVDAFGVPREQIAFAAFGGWDAAGAAWFGFPTFWVNRLGLPREELSATFTTIPDLATLVSHLASREYRDGA